jgi:hypothetical protein
MRLDAQTGRILLRNQQEVSADVHCLVVGQVDIPVRVMTDSTALRVRWLT